MRKMVLFGYIIETVILFIWFQMIVKKELKNNSINERNIIRRTIKLIYDNKKIIKYNILGLIRYNEEKKKNIEKVKKYIINLFCLVELFCLVYIFLPVYMKYFIEEKNIYVILYSVIVVGVFINALKEYTQNFIDAYIVYIKYVMIPLEKNNNLIMPEEKEYMKIELDKKRKLYIFVGIIMFVILESLLILGLNIKWNKEIKIVSAIVFLMIIPYLFLKRYSEINKHKYYENISFDSIDFILIEDDVRELCKKFKIDNIKFKVEKDDINNVLVKMDDNDIYEVIVFQGFLEVLKDINKIYGSNIKEMFLVTIGHELGHIYYNDLKNYTKRVRWSCIIYMLFIYGSVFLLIINMEVFRFISIMLLFFSWFVGDVMIDIRYWKQIAEIKADRLAVDRCENGRKAFIDIWGNEKKFKEDKLKIKKIEKSNIIYKYYKRYIENESHPSMERRVYLVKNRSKWKWWEYIEHALLIRKWRFSGKGWNGR